MNLILKQRRITFLNQIYYMETIMYADLFCFLTASSSIPEKFRRLLHVTGFTEQ